MQILYSNCQIWNMEVLNLSKKNLQACFLSTDFYDDSNPTIQVNLDFLYFRFGYWWYSSSQ